MKNVLLLFVLLALSLTTTAQDAPETPEPSPFLQAMARVPDVPLIRDGAPIVSYGAYHEGIHARGGEVPDSVAAVRDSGDLSALIALPAAGPYNLRFHLGGFGIRYPTVVGFDYFQITHGIEAGRITTIAHILTGDFDPEAVIAAHAARGYTAEAWANGTLLCPPDGCETGTVQRLQETNPANPFGGHLGRSEPLYITETVLLNSPDFEMLQALIAVEEGGAPTLADDPAFQAVSNVLSQYPAVTMVLAFDAVHIAPRADDALIVPDVTDVAPLPATELAFFASAADDESEFALLVLVYPDADAGAAAAEAINLRLNAPISTDGATYADYYEEVGTLEPAQAATDSATGIQMVVIRLVAPKPPDLADDEDFTPSNMLLRRLMVGLNQSGIPWLIVNDGE